MYVCQKFRFNRTAEIGAVEGVSVTNDISYLSIQRIAENVCPSGFWIQNGKAEIQMQNFPETRCDTWSVYIQGEVHDLEFQERVL